MKTDEREPRRRKALVVAGAVTLTVLALFVFLMVSVSKGRRPAAPDSSDALTIEVVGHRWWWEVRYSSPVPAHRVVEANEIHIPVGRPVRIRGTSRDVVHGFWVPSLQARLDLSPGRTGETWIRAGKPGVHRGLCAKFCGRQHAQMRFLVIAEPEEVFQAWLEARSKPAPPPRTPLEARGQQVFLRLQCSLCHTIRGIEAHGAEGPDLTHIASRRTLGAGILPNTRGHLAQWVVGAQDVKPGNLMPPAAIRPEDLPPLLAYLESLK